jgi:predicted phage tail protein
MNRKHLLALFLVFVVGTVGSVKAQTATTRVTPCNAATPNNALCVLWTAPANNTDGTPIVLALTYRVERLTQTNPATWMTVNTVSTTQAYVTNLAPGTYTFRVIAIAGGKESDPSNSAAGTVATPTPNPVVITIAVNISPDAPPTIVQVNGAQVYANR